MLTLNQGPFAFPFPASEEGDKKPRGSTARTAGLSWPKVYSIPQNILLSTSLGGVGWEGLIAAQGQSGLWSVGGKELIALCITCLS